MAAMDLAARATLLLALVLSPPLAAAGIPDPFRPMVVDAPFAMSERRFDLNPAIAKARAEKKLLFVYLGASDCPYCVAYERFLRAHTQALLPVYERYVVVDIRTWLKGPKPTFLVGDRTYTFGDFNTAVGDRGPKSPRYPYFWILTPELKAKALPRGDGFYSDVGEHRRALGG
ncbi:MAG: thioredoxin family protein [Gemmatimonadaceae bacterium]